MNPAFPTALRVLLVMAAGALAVSALRPMLAAVTAPNIPVMWWCARAFGLLAYVALWLSQISGLLISSKGGGGLLEKSTATWLHNRWALAAQVATVLHVVFVVVDPVSGVSALAAFVPFTSATLTGPVALGTFAVWGLALLLVTTALSRRLSRTTWRAVHASAFGTFVLAALHGASAGADTVSPLIRGMYLITAALLVGGIVHRGLVARAERAEAPSKGAKTP